RLTLSLRTLLGGSFDSKTKSLGRGIRELRGRDLTQAQCAPYSCCSGLSFRSRAGKREPSSSTLWKDEVKSSAKAHSMASKTPGWAKRREGANRSTDPEEERRRCTQ